MYRFETLQQHFNFAAIWWNVPICCPIHLKNVYSSYYVNYCIILIVS